MKNILKKKYMFLFVIILSGFLIVSTMDDIDFIVIN